MKEDLKRISYKGQNLTGADFSGADLCGADFSGAVLTNANFSKCKTGLKTSSAVIVFIFSSMISLLSGYFAMLTGSTIQFMLKSGDNRIVISGYIVFGLILVSLVLTIWKGGRNMITSILATILVALIIGLINYLSGLGTGMGSVYGSFALILFMVMVVAGTTARASAGTLSSTIIFLIVAIGGGIFGKSLGGGIGTVALAISCAIISKRALSDKNNFPMLYKIALTVGSYLGTSFKDADLTGANFSESKITNTDFTGANLSGVNWEKSVKKFTLGDN